MLHQKYDIRLQRHAYMVICKICIMNICKLNTCSNRTLGRNSFINELNGLSVGLHLSVNNSSTFLSNVFLDFFYVLSKKFV